MLGKMPAVGHHQLLQLGIPGRTAITMGYKKHLIFLFSTHKMSGAIKIRMMLKFLEQEQNYLKGAYLSSCLQINIIPLLIGNSTFNSQHNGF